MSSTNMRIREVRYSYEDYLYRTPIKFGGMALDRVTLLNVQIDVEDRSGRRSMGMGSMPLGNVWSYPSRRLTYAQTLMSMKRAAELIAKRYSDYTEEGHPIDLGHHLEKEAIGFASQITQEQNLIDPMPPLALLVVNSPFDAALHDAFGKLHQCSAYQTYGRDFLAKDLGDYLGEAFQGYHLEDYVRRTPVPRLPLYHLVGALDPLTPAEVVTPIRDGLPEHLGEWVVYNGLTHLKIKLNGEDLDWDAHRVLAVDRVVTETKGTDSTWFYSLDFNERCGNVEYLLEFIHRVKEANPRAFSRVQYIEQPTKRDLKADRANTMHRASQLVPVVIDESLLDLESLEIAQEMGYTGAALKACKGQTQSLLLAAAAQIKKMFLCVQDLTCPGASLIHSAGLAAHVPTVAAIEANARQYCPAANEPWKAWQPGLFHITNGMVDTSGLVGPGIIGTPPERAV